MYMYEVFGSNFHEFRLLYYFILVQILIVRVVPRHLRNHPRSLHGVLSLGKPSWSDCSGGITFFPYAWTILINNIKHETSSNYINPSFTGIDLYTMEQRLIDLHPLFRKKSGNVLCGWKSGYADGATYNSKYKHVEAKCVFWCLNLPSGNLI